MAAETLALLLIALKIVGALLALLFGVCALGFGLVLAIIAVEAAADAINTRIKGGKKNGRD